MRSERSELITAIGIPGVDLVDYIDKGSIFGLTTITNRQSAMRGFQITTRRLDTTTTSQDIEEKVDLDVIYDECKVDVATARLYLQYTLTT